MDIMLPQEIIRSIQLAGLEMFHKFDAICIKYKIQYFAHYGTLLGAIRHQGYIPWDDDLDIGMLREDYNKLLLVPANEWEGVRLELISPEMPDIKHDKFFPRVYLKDSQIQSYIDVENWINPLTGEAWFTSLMIDIFIFDSVPNDNKVYNKAVKKIHRFLPWYKPLKLKCNINRVHGIKKAKNIVKLLYGTCFRTFVDQPWAQLYKKYLKVIESIKPGSRIAYYISDYDKLCFEKDEMFPLIKTKFEDFEIPIPKNYQDFLTAAYGDYMQYPPESERFHIHFIYADLGNGTVFNIEPIAGSLGAKKIKK